MDLLQYTESRSPELADYLLAVAASPLSFDGLHPLSHSSENHVHLWKLEYLADVYDWIDVDYRVKFANYILEQWRRRLKGLPPYRQAGYRLYLYADLAPTVSAVAETGIGFPYEKEHVVFVNSVQDVMELYENQSWREYWNSPGWEISHEHILAVITKNNGSISKPSAQQLGLPVGKLRSLIINLGIESEVNKIRKQFRRRPADFSNEGRSIYSQRMFERILPAGYQ